MKALDFIKALEAMCTDSPNIGSQNFYEIESAERARDMFGGEPLTYSHNFVPGWHVVLWSDTEEHTELLGRIRDITGEYHCADAVLTDVTLFSKKRIYIYIIPLQ